MPNSPKPLRLELKTLIQGIGGEGVFLSILQRFYLRMSQDVMIGFFFRGHDIRIVAEKFGAFALQAAGIRSPNDAPIRGPATAHTALPPILSGHFDRRIELLKETLVESGITPEHQEIWIRFETSFREMVVKN